MAPETALGEHFLAVTGLIALIDDVATLLDDVAAMSKVAAEKTAGIAGDDLAVNAQAVIGIDPSRELPIVAKVAAGSLANKVVLVPLALTLPASVLHPLLMIGGAYLCYEAVHKVFHAASEKVPLPHADLVAAVKAGPEAVAAREAAKVKGAILTDVVLSAEIVAVALASLDDQPFRLKAYALSLVSVLMTVLIYGFVPLS